MRNPAHSFITVRKPFTTSLLSTFSLFFFTTDFKQIILEVSADTCCIVLTSKQENRAGKNNRAEGQEY